MRKVAALGVVCASLAASSPARAHDDSIPDRKVFVLPGLLLTPGFRACCTGEGAFADAGVEVSAHRFVRHEGATFANQLGYGALVQAQLAGLDGEKEDPRGPGLHARVALGAQATFSFFGVQAGMMTRAGSHRYGTAIGPFVDVFVSIAFISAGVQYDIPIPRGEGSMPVLFTIPITLKWYFPINLDPPVGQRSSRPAYIATDGSKATHRER